MPRNMSFFYTQQQVRDQIKDVTRRDGWADLEPGELFWAVEKSQGLGRGGQIVRICLCRCLSNRPEPLRVLLDDLDYGFSEVRREGFADHPAVNGFPSAFVEMFIGHMGGDLDTPRNRIEFAYVPRHEWHNETCREEQWKKETRRRRVRVQ